MYKCRGEKLLFKEAYNHDSTVYELNFRACPLKDNYEENINFRSEFCPEFCLCNAYYEIKCEKIIYKKTKYFWKIIYLRNFNENYKKRHFFSNLNYKTTKLEIFNSTLKTIEILKNLKNLVKFNSTKNKFIFLSEKYLNSKKLQIFILTENQRILNINFKCKNIFNSFILLNLSKNIIKNSSLIGFFHKLTNLTELYLKNVQIDLIEKNLFQNLTKLKILNIQNFKLLKNKEFVGNNLKFLKSLNTLVSSNWAFCCLFQHQNIELCLPKKEKGTSSCKDLIASVFLKCKFKNS